MNYYLNVSLVGSSTKNDRCQDVTNNLKEKKKLCTVQIFQIEK